MFQLFLTSTEFRGLKRFADKEAAIFMRIDTAWVFEEKVIETQGHKDTKGEHYSFVIEFSFSCSCSEFSKVKKVALRRVPPDDLDMCQLNLRLVQDL